MFKVMIVDDEIIFREYVSTLINWKEYGFEICAEYKNGNEALEMCESLKPDIALIDINMPIMDGFILSEKLKEKYQDIGIVLITGYNEFEYAKRAIKIGIDDYIVKPFDENELLATMLKVKGRLQKVVDKRSNMIQNLNNRREIVLNLLLEGEYSMNDSIVNMHKSRFSIDLDVHSFLVTTIEIDNIYRKWYSVDEIINNQYAVISVLNDLVKVECEHCKHIVFRGPENRIISIVGSDSEYEISSFDTQIFIKISEFIRTYYDFTVTIGIGNGVLGFDMIRQSYLESLDALRYKVLSGGGSVIHYSKVKSDVMNCGFYPNGINIKLINYLRLNDFEHIKKELDHVFTNVNNKKLSIDCRYAVIMGLKSVCLSYIIEMGKNIEEVFGNGYSPMDIISNKQPIERSYQELIKVFETTVQYFSKNKNTKAMKIAEIVKVYIDEHYMDSDLSLEKIARNLYVSADYLRKVFKQELNITLTDYITSVRMQKAKLLIDNGNVKFTNLCSEVGYNDVSYFSKCFKKYYGMSPRDYENSKTV